MLGPTHMLSQPPHEPSLATCPLHPLARRDQLGAGSAAKGEAAGGWHGLCASCGGSRPAASDLLTAVSIWGMEKQGMGKGDTVHQAVLLEGRRVGDMNCRVPMHDRCQVGTFSSNRASLRLKHMSGSTWANSIPGIHHLLALGPDLSSRWARSRDIHLGGRGQSRGPLASRAFPFIAFIYFFGYLIN